ncbi:hypothetical protein NDU88_006619 [Pleurodeles waltl]|uniref:Uncharacterized protein n=1 Tax=Pleurodeles waltl TaxID=8319 RepID=A0AAV7MGF3_PLEWA|nr:hypothetical protein NDU88_006619 [Pleurodeles waltl]
MKEGHNKDKKQMRETPGLEADGQSREKEEDEEREEWFEAESWDSAGEAKVPATVLENLGTHGSPLPVVVVDACLDGGLTDMEAGVDGGGGTTSLLAG